VDKSRPALIETAHAFAIENQERSA
jgi:hypothetical protein